MTTLTQFIEALPSWVKTLVVINERTHYIFTDTSEDTIQAGWSDLFKFEKIVSENYYSMIVEVKYIDEE